MAPSIPSRMYKKLRIPVLVASLLFLAGSIAFYIDGLPAHAYAETAEDRAQYRAKMEAYTKRLRDDAFAHLAKGDDEIALARLDDAASWDRKGDRTPEVQSARRKIAADLGFDDDDDAAAPETPSPTETEGHAP